MPYACKPVQTIRLSYSSTNVTTSAYVQLSASTTQDCTEADIFDSSGSVLKLALGAAGSEVDIPANITPGGTEGRVPLPILKGTRLSIQAVDTNATTGQIVINLYA